MDGNWTENGWTWMKMDEELMNMDEHDPFMDFYG